MSEREAEREGEGEGKKRRGGKKWFALALL